MKPKLGPPLLLLFVAGLHFLGSVSKLSAAVSGSVELVLYAPDGSIDYRPTVRHDGQTLANLNQTFALQPGIQYSLQIFSGAGANSDPGSTAGYRFALNVSATFSSAPTLAATRTHFVVNALRYGVGDSAGEILETLPFARQYSATFSNYEGSAFAAGHFSVRFNELTLEVVGAAMADSANFPFYNYFTGIAGAGTQISFSVTQPTTLSIVGVMAVAGRGSSQDFPIIPTLGGRFDPVPTDNWYDPPMAQGYTFTMLGTALFNQIMAFPTGIPAEYYVITEAQTYGPFTPPDSIDFRTLHGHGVSSFVIKGIKPFVSATSPVAFPIKLSFNQPTASFTMVPILAPDIQVETLANGDVQFTFDGVLQSSSDLIQWNDVLPTPVSPYVIPKPQVSGGQFYRSRDP